MHYKVGEAEPWTVRFKLNGVYQDLRLYTLTFVARAEKGVGQPILSLADDDFIRQSDPTYAQALVNFAGVAPGNYVGELTVAGAETLNKSFDVAIKVEKAVA